jgi:signal transduction histidine kinase
MTAPAPVRVLLVEDVDEDAALLEHLVSRAPGAAFTLRRAALVREALDILGAEAVDVVLLDLGLPDAFGLSGLDRLLAAAPTVPVVVMTGAERDELAGQALQRGAEDFLVKGTLGSDALARSIRHALARKRAELALRRTHEQLRTSHKMEAIGRLAAGLAHDLNGVVTAILGYADLLVETTPTEDPRRADIEEIQRAGERAASLTRQVLAFSRREVARPQLLAFDIVVGDLLRMLRRLVGGHVTMRVDLRAQGAVVLADPSQIEQVVMNLVLNARDALFGGGTVTVRTAILEPTDAKEGATSTVELVVADDGAGMTSETMARIFEPFFTTKEVGKGTGLGLATVRRIVAELGGRIGVESTAGRGSTFHVELPRAMGTPTTANADAEPEPPPRGTETVLVTDGDEGVRSLTRRVLERAGYEVLEAATAEEALLVANHHDGPIHLLVTDVVLPGLSGATLAEHLRRERPEARVLYTSGYCSSETPPFGLDLRGRYLEKPYRREDLVREVRASLDAPRRR